MPPIPTKCDQCGGAMRTASENIRWDALPSAVILGAEVARCTACGAHGVTFPALSKLVDLAAHTVVSKQGRLGGGEVRFLRSVLGLDGGELADALGSSPSTLSRWEHDRQPIGRHADLFLRALVLLQLGGEPTPATYFQRIAKDILPAQLLAFAFVGGTWIVSQLDHDTTAKPKKTKPEGARRATRGRA